MRRIVLILALAGGLLILAFGQKQNGDDKQAERAAQELRQFERDWITASMNHDNDWQQRFFANKLLVIPAESETVKNRAPEIAQTVESMIPADLLTPRDMKVRITGTISVLTNDSSETGGKNRSYSFLDTFNKQGGKWRVIATHFSPVSETTGENVEQTIIQLESKCDELTAKKSVAGLQEFIADDFTGIKSNGAVINKSQVLADVQSRNNNVQSETFEDMNVRVYGDNAVVTKKLKVKKMNSPLLVVDIWAKRNNQWRMVNYQATRRLTLISVGKKDYY
jgi:hypothetical protein